MRHDDFFLRLDRKANKNHDKTSLFHDEMLAMLINDEIGETKLNGFL